MDTFSLQIKNMVCPRCILAIEQIVKQQKLPQTHISLGEVLFEKKISDTELLEFKKAIELIGFELMQNKETVLVEKIKQNLLAYYLVDNDIKFLKTYKEHLSENLKEEITKLNELYFKNSGKTIEQLAILIRIEKIKQLLTYDNYSIKEISYKLNYSSVAYLSKQFKSIVGLTPTEFRDLVVKNRKGIESL